MNSRMLQFMLVSVLLLQGYLYHKAAAEWKRKSLQHAIQTHQCYVECEAALKSCKKGD